MSVEFVGIAVGLTGLILLLTSFNLLIRFFICTTVLGSAAAVLLGGSGNIPPAHVPLFLIALNTSLNKKLIERICSAMRFPQPGFWLILFLAYSAISAYFFPRLFTGQTYINAIGSTEYGPTVSLIPLVPTSGNFTQLAYLAADISTFLILSCSSIDRRDIEYLARSVQIFGLFVIIFAIIDIAASMLDVSYLLDPIRNATYQLHVDEVAGGTRRITGSFLEASAFASASLGVFVYNANLWLAGVWTKSTATLGITAFLLLVLSTSSTALIAAPIVLVLIYFVAALNLIRGHRVSANILFLSILPVAFLLLIFMVLLNADLQQVLYLYVQDLIINKPYSQSGLERAEWNASAFQNFMDTYFLGGGLGSIRASSFILALLSNVGAPGAILFIGFLFALSRKQSSLNNSDIEVKRIKFASLITCYSLIIIATISGALVDLGLTFYIYAALACVRSPRNHHLDGYHPPV